MLIIVMIISTVILFIPTVTAEKAKQSAWIVPIIASSAGVVTLWLVTQLGRRFPSYTLPQYSQIILGKFFGKLLGIWYLLAFTFVCIVIARQFTEFILITLLPGTPPIVLNVVIVLVAVYATSKGLEVIARINQFIFPLLLTALLVGFTLAWFKLDLDRILPVLEEGIKPIILASMAPASWYGEVIIIAFILPQLNKPKDIFQKGFIGLMISAGLMVLMTLFTLAIFGSALTSSLTFPFWSVIRSLEFGRYIQRLESYLSIIWITSMVVKLSLFTYVASLTSTQLFPIKSKIVLYPLGGVTVIASVYGFKNIEQFTNIITNTWPIFGLMSEIGFPFLLLIVAVLRGKMEGDQS